MASAFLLPFNVDNQAIWRDHVSSCRGYIPPFHLKPVYKYEQLFHQQSQNNYLKEHLFQLVHLHISVNMAVVKNANSITLVCDDDVINKIECKYQTKLNFAQIMGARLCICKDRKVFSSEVCIKLQCDRICFSGSKQYSLKVENIQIT